MNDALTLLDEAVVLAKAGEPLPVDWFRRYHALKRAAQPAAPTRIDSGVAVMTELHQMAAAPTRTENWTSCPVCGTKVLESEWTTHMNGHSAPTRTEAEQRVLDAMAAAHTYDLLDDLHGGDRWRKRAAQAELARRGLKP